MDLPESPGTEYAGSYMEFTVNGKKTRAEFDSSLTNADGTLYRFTCYVNAVQMADEIEAVYHYLLNGEEETIRETYSVKEYVQEFDAEGGFDEKTIALVHALADYGHFAQTYLSGIRHWEIGKDHAAMDIVYKNAYSDDDLLAVKGAVDGQKPDVSNSGGITGASLSLILESETAACIYLRTGDGFTGELSVTVNGQDASARRLSDGRFLISLSGIAAHQLGDAFAVEASYDGGTFKAKLSVLSYVWMAFSGEPEKAESNAMAALYYYSAAAKAYIA